MTTNATTNNATTDNATDVIDFTVYSRPNYVYVEGTQIWGAWEPSNEEFRPYWENHWQDEDTVSNRDRWLRSGVPLDVGGKTITPEEHEDRVRTMIKHGASDRAQALRWIDQAGW